MGALIRILAPARSQWPWLLLGGLLAIVVLIANAVLMAVSGWFIASMAVAGATGVAFNYIIPETMIRLLAICRTIGRYLERLVTHEAGFRVLAELRVWFFRQVAPLAPAGLECYTSGDLAGRLRSDIDALESLYLRIILPLANGVAGMALSFVFVACWSLSAALALLFFLLVAGLLVPLLARQLSRAPGVRATALSGELRATVTEGLQGGEELILLGAVELQADRVAQISRQLVGEQQRLARISGLTLAAVITCAGCGVAAVLYCAGHAVAAGSLAGPLLVMLLLFAAASFESVAAMPQAMQLVPGAREAVRRIRELTDAPLPLPEPASPALLPAGTAIEFQNVSFSYDPAKPVLADFSLSVPAGRKVALTGPSGCGKSTVGDLLIRCRPYLGSITIGGAEVRELASDTLLQLLTVVPQQPHLFNATIRENLLKANPEATEEELHRALNDACLNDWVAQLPAGLETRVGEGGSAVSGGEARRIALARALLKDAPIVILDEPTEGLDLATERAVVARLAEVLAGRSVLIISHRPACLELADTVFRLSPVAQGGGNIIE